MGDNFYKWTGFTREQAKAIMLHQRYSVLPARAMAPGAYMHEGGGPLSPEWLELPAPEGMIVPDGNGCANGSYEQTS